MATKRRTTSRNHGYTNQMRTLHEKAAADRKRPARRNSTVRMPAVAGNPTDRESYLTDELVMFIDNDGGMYDQIVGVRKNLVNRQARDAFDRVEAIKAWLRVTNKGAKEYHRQIPNFESGQMSHGSYGAFSPDVRWLAARVMLEQYEVAANYGEYDFLLAKKYQSKPTPRPRRRNKTLNVSENMGHYPRTAAGRKGTDTWFIFDIFAGRDEHISTRIKKLTKAKAHLEAGALVGHRLGRKIVRKVELAGPYSRKPSAKTARK